MQEFQQTIKYGKSISGVALHNGENCCLTLKPAQQGGIVFYRIDLDISPSAKKIEASYRYRANSNYHTVLEKNGVRVATTEHFLSALYALGIDNLLVELDNAELPILDGSSKKWVEFLESCGIQKLKTPRVFFQVKKKVRVGNNNNYAFFRPCNKIRYQFFIDFDHPIIQEQHYSCDLELTHYKKEIAPCRTFGFEKDIEKMRKQELIKGATLKNAIVLSKDGKLFNQGALFFSDEFVRHKILDAIGDTYLGGMPIIGEYYGYKSSHKLNLDLLEKLLS